MKLYLTIRGEEYKIKKNGDMLQVNNTYNEWNKNWKLLGVSFHHWKQGIDKTMKEIWNDPKVAIGGLLWDLDHGTTRQWGGQYCGKLPRITSAYKK